MVMAWSKTHGTVGISAKPLKFVHETLPTNIYEFCLTICEEKKFPENSKQFSNKTNKISKQIHYYFIT